MKKTTLLLIMLLTFSFGFGQTILSAGEVAVTGINSEIPEDVDAGIPADTTDEFSFVLLNDITSGTIINFTDCGWTTAGNFRNLNVGTGAIAEGIVTWTATSDLSCGTEIIITDTGSNTWSATLGTAVESDLGFDLRRNGDQLILFQGTTIAPSFIFAVHFATNTGWTDATNTRFSAVPTGLTDGVDAVFRNRDNIVYKYNITGNTSSILAATVEPGEWLGSNTAFQTLGLPGGVSFTCSTSILDAGNVAISGANAGIVGDDTDEFSFVLLTDIVSGTEINFTDCGWLAAGGFRNFTFNNTNGNTIGEGFIKWTAPSDLSCGTEVIISDTGGNTWSATLGTAIEAETGFDLARGGDQILSFQGTTATPTFLFGLHFANNAGWSTDSTSNSTSVVPTGLAEGIDAVARNRDNIVFKYNVTGNTTLILGATVDPGEWIGSNSVRQTLGLPSGVSFTCNTTILGAGDVAITGTNADNPDEFSFVLLTDIVSGTEINFTDCGWLAVGSFRNYSFGNANGSSIGEGAIKWTASSDLTCGTEIIILDTGSDTWSATSGVAVESETGFAFGNADQLIAYQQTIATPKFLYAFHFGNALGWTDATDAANSAVPAGLTDTVNAIAFDADNSIYNYSVLADQSLILAAIVDTSNWSGSNGTRQTLGLPIGVFFTCTPSGSCGGGIVTWSGGAWFGGTPDISTEVVIATDYSTTGIGAENFSSCSLTINSGATLTVENDTFIIVQNDVTIDGDIIVETRGNFIQTDGSGAISGNCTLNKTTPVKQEYFFYTYWSSPVSNETIENVFPLVDSGRRFSFNADNFLDNDPTDDVDDDANDWEIVDGTDTMIPGVGYAALGERVNSGSYPRADNVSFTGTFNTGDIPVNITFDPANLGMKWNFIGNPYPGAIDFVAFQLANSAILDGVAYFWSQATPPSESNPGNAKLNLSQNDYAVFTVGTGGVDGGSGVIPNGYVASGQGFFIPALAIGTATFTNDVRAVNDTSNGQFFKESSSKKSNASAANPLENKLWINLTTDSGVFNQILVGYVENATDNNDGMSYDAPKLLIPGFAAALYSSAEENSDIKYVIQGKDINSINEEEIIKLGFINEKVDEDTQFKLSIKQFEGEFLNTNTVYLKDNLMDITHNLTDSDYDFTSEFGTFNDRFEIVFKAEALSTKENRFENSPLSIIELNNNDVKFNTSENLTIKKVAIYDLLGRQLYNLKGNKSSETYRLSNLSNAAYIVKVELSNGAIITKKIIKR